ncbi:MAG: hypothetical protein JWR81_3480 [Pseudonocardia sp.]|nr:hypothetical protein [Pseudonocardia sp.]
MQRNLREGDRAANPHGGGRLADEAFLHVLAEDDHVPVLEERPIGKQPRVIETEGGFRIWELARNVGKCCVHGGLPGKGKG